MPSNGLRPKAYRSAPGAKTKSGARSIRTISASGTRRRTARPALMPPNEAPRMTSRRPLGEAPSPEIVGRV